jgi:hypothetical protein
LGTLTVKGQISGDGYKIKLDDGGKARATYTRK